VPRLDLLRVSTVDSTGEVRTSWSYLLRRMKTLKSRAINCGPLSEMMRGRALVFLPRSLHDGLDIDFFIDSRISSGR